MISEKVRLLEHENEVLKEEIEHLKQLYGDDYKPMRCQECEHFHQHYVRCGSFYNKINEGYCTAGKRFKSKRAEDERCQFFNQRR